MNVSWHEALQYCGWLEQAVGESPQTPAELKNLLASGWHVGLPSKAEWEKAARGTLGRTYPWREGIGPDRANYTAAKRGGLTPAGSFLRGASPYGVLDMSGNVWDWTRSLYRPYPYVASDGREDPKGCGLRVLRGGSFNAMERHVRAASRLNHDPDDRHYSIGFRVVVSRF